MSDHTGPAGTGRLVTFSSMESATVEREGERSEHRLHRGCRFGYLGPDPRNPSLMVLAFEGGPGPGPADEALLAVVSPDGLEALARDLLSVVERHRSGLAIDMRFLT